MEEIKEYLIGKYNETDNLRIKEKIKILLQKEVVTYCKCPKCNTKFEPKEAFKSGLVMFT